MAGLARIWLFVIGAFRRTAVFAGSRRGPTTRPSPRNCSRFLTTTSKRAGRSKGCPASRCRWTAARGQPILALYAGDDGLGDKKPIGPDTLFDIGSNTKEFTAALILKLEAAGKLKLDDTIGKWLPQYPAWKDVTIRSLLQMTSPIPNYSETVAIGEIQVADLHHQFSDADLIGFVDPGKRQAFSARHGVVLFQHQLHSCRPDHRGGVRHGLRAGADDDDFCAAGAARHLLRRRAASGACGRRPGDGARAARAVPAAGLLDVSAGALP